MRGLGTVALKCVGVLVMVGAFRLTEIALMLTLGDEGPPLVITLLAWATALAQFLVGLWLVLRGGRLAARWFDDAPVSVSSGPRVILRLALIILGVVFVALAVTGLLRAVSAAVFLTSSDFLGTEVSWNWVNALLGAIYPLAQLVAGILLIAYSPRLSRRLWREAPPSVAERDSDAAPQDAV